MSTSRTLTFATPLLLSLIAAGPDRGLTLTVPKPDLAGNGATVQPIRRPVQQPPVAFEPAPLPNRDLDGPSLGRASTSPSLSPSLFSRTDTYRGEGFDKNNSAQIDQDKRAHPAAGFSLRMPFTPN